MIKKYAALAALLVLVATIASPVVAQDSTSMAGAWKIVQEARGRTMESTLTLSQDDDGIWSGTMAGRGGTSDLADVVFDDGRLSFKRSINSDTMRNKIQMTIEVAAKMIRMARNRLNGSSSLRYGASFPLKFSATK